MEIEKVSSKETASTSARDSNLPDEPQTNTNYAQVVAANAGNNLENPYSNGNAPNVSPSSLVQQKQEFNASSMNTNPYGKGGASSSSSSNANPRNNSNDFTSPNPIAQDGKR